MLVGGGDVTLLGQGFHVGPLLVPGNLLPPCNFPMLALSESHQLGWLACAQPGSNALSLAQGSPVVRAKEGEPRKAACS